MAALPMAQDQRVIIDDERPKLVVSRPMPLACTTCMAMSGNGVQTIGMEIITECLQMVLHGYLAMNLLSGCCAVAPGTTLQIIADLPFATTPV